MEQEQFSSTHEVSMFRCCTLFPKLFFRNHQPTSQQPVVAIKHPKRIGFQVLVREELCTNTQYCLRWANEHYPVVWMVPILQVHIWSATGELILQANKLSHAVILFVIGSWFANWSAKGEPHQGHRQVFPLYGFTMWPCKCAWSFANLSKTKTAIFIFDSTAGVKYRENVQRCKKTTEQIKKL